MSGSLLLQGGDEFHDLCRPMDMAFLECIGDGTIVIYPGASEESDLAGAGEQAAAYYRSLGADVVISPVDPHEAVATMAPAKAVVLPGGSPARLLGQLQAEGGLLADALRGILLGGGGISGSSAGAMVLGALVWLPESGQVVPGLGLVPELLLPHAEPSPSRWLSVCPTARGVDPSIHCLAIAERSGLLLTSGEERTFGSVYRWE